VFYELIGRLLVQAAASLAADRPGELDDERWQRERRRITALLRRMGAIWPQLFRALREESSILEETLRRAIEVGRARGLREADSSALPESEDPLAHYRALHCSLDEWVVVLREHDQEAWAQDALVALRAGLGDAAEVQGRLVDEMLAA